MKPNTPMTETEKRRWHNYHKRGGHNLSRCPVDKFHVNTGDSIEHETKKLEIYMKLRKDGHRVLTEAVHNKTGLRRDIVDLTDGIIYEIETDAARGERHKGNKDVTVIYVSKNEVR